MNVDLGSLWTAAGVLIGFQVTALMWRITREVSVGDEDRLTWLPPADMINLISLVVTMIGIFIIPSLGYGSLSLVKKSFGLSVLLLTGYPFALIGHYDLFGTKGRSWDYFTKQEKVVVSILAAAAAFYVVWAILA
jgi:hypothetical protein